MPKVAIPGIRFPVPLGHPLITIGGTLLPLFWPQDERELRSEWYGIKPALQCDHVPTYDDGFYSSSQLTTDNPGCLVLQAIVNPFPLESLNAFGPLKTINHTNPDGSVRRYTISERRVTLSTRYAYRQLLFFPANSAYRQILWRPKPARGPIPANMPDASPVPRPFHEPLPYGQPAENPWAEPGYQPAPAPVQVPMWPPIQIPGFQPIPSPRPQPSPREQPRPRPYERPMIGNYVGGPRPGVRPGLHRLRRPPRGHRQVKINGGKVAHLFKVFINVVTETTDVIDAIWKAIPRKKKAADRVSWTMSPGARAAYIMANLDSVNWEVFAGNMIKNQFEDWVYGQLGKGDKWRYQQSNSAGFNSVQGSRVFDTQIDTEHDGNPVIDAFNDMIDNVVAQPGY